MADLYFEDLRPGLRFQTRAVTLTEAQIIEFAFQFDPQAIHTDGHAAKQSPYGGIIASGVHTLAVACRLIQQEKPWAAAGLGAPGIEELRWQQPVRPGDSLRVVVEVHSVRPSASRPDRGIVHLLHAVFNQDDAQVMSYALSEFVARRPVDARKSPPMPPSAT